MSFDVYKTFTQINQRNIIDRNENSTVSTNAPNMIYNDFMNIYKGKSTTKLEKNITIYFSPNDNSIDFKLKLC